MNNLNRLKLASIAVAVLILIFVIMAHLLEGYTTEDIINSDTIQKTSDIKNPQNSNVNKITEEHDYVDLGLSVKWATKNVGALSPYDHGNNYAWGETTTKSDYTEENYKILKLSIGDIEGNPQYDAARANWGESWRMPTVTEFQELIDNCIWKWTTQGNHRGYRVTSKINGHSIFLPALMGIYETDCYFCSYRSSTLIKSDIHVDNYVLFIDSTNNRPAIHKELLYNGLPVRPVTE